MRKYRLWGGVRLVQIFGNCKGVRDVFIGGGIVDEREGISGAAVGIGRSGCDAVRFVEGFNVGAFDELGFMW